MAVESSLPQIVALRERIESRYGRLLLTHNDFVELALKVRETTRKHISETTLERVWSYSTRGYANISVYTLNVLSEYAGYKDWQRFCSELKIEADSDSGMFDDPVLFSKELQPGDRIKIGWLPDRVCIIKYLGDNRFIAEECHNTTMKEGDIFSCLEFRINHPAVMTDFHSADGKVKGERYVAGMQKGLTMLKHLIKEGSAID